MPLIHDLLPMILPSSIYISKATPPGHRDPNAALDAESAKASGSSSSAVVERAAVVDKSDKLCATGKYAAILPRNNYFECEARGDFVGTLRSKTEAASSTFRVRVCQSLWRLEFLGPMTCCSATHPLTRQHALPVLRIRPHSSSPIHHHGEQGKLAPFLRFQLESHDTPEDTVRRRKCN